MTRYATLLLLVAVCTIGCGYGEVSPTTYEIAKSLYSISNRKLSGHLDTAKDQIVTSCECGDVSAREAKWLKAIVADAERERWQRAMKSARRLMEDQVDR